MKFDSTKKKFDYLLELISNECTGNADDLCEKIFVSPRTLFRYLDCLREMGYQISYCLQRKTYYLIQDDKKNKRLQ
jgi:predicted DNA-binding transcriptional regulator YafY